MSDPRLQELTASEPLTLEEEYEMQSTYVLGPLIRHIAYSPSQRSREMAVRRRQCVLMLLSMMPTTRLSNHMKTELTFIICARTSGETATEVTSSALTMIGDVNLFLKGEPVDPDFEVEVEIMIAGEYTSKRAPHLGPTC